ncbi:MAG: hypothetical protein Q9174_006443, partial [Haloplaca sp. 1 TL-2023]
HDTFVILAICRAFPTFYLKRRSFHLRRGQPSISDRPILALNSRLRGWCFKYLVRPTDDFGPRSELTETPTVFFPDHIKPRHQQCLDTGTLHRFRLLSRSYRSLARCQVLLL